MDPKAFQDTLYETLLRHKEFNSLETKEDLELILQYCSLNLIDTGTFTKKSYQYYQDIEVRVPAHMLDFEDEVFDDLEDLIKFVYMETETFALGNIDIRPKIQQTSTELCQRDSKVKFEGIKKMILESIRTARYSIWVCVAWFTDKDYFNALCNRKNDGLEIRVIMSDEDSNQNMIKELQNKGIETHVIRKFGIKGINRMHSKFCIVDLENILHGSYNWTPTASNNKESYVMNHEKSLVNEFAKEFVELVSTYQ